MTGWRSQFRTAGAALRLGGQAAGGLAVGVAVLTVAVGAAPAVTAWLTKLVVDSLTGAHPADATRVVWLAAAAAGAAGLGSVLGYVTGFLTYRMQNHITLYVQEKLYSRVNRFIGLRQFEDPRFADRLRLAEDAAKDAPGVLALFLITAVRSAAGVIGFVAVLLAIWAPMALLLLAVATVAVIAQLSLARRQADVAQATMATQRRQFMYQHLLTDLRAAKETRLFGLAGLFQGRMMNALRHTTHAELGVQRRSTAIQIALATLAALVTAIGSAVVVWRAARGQLTAGDLVLFIAAAAAVQTSIFGVISQLQAAVSSTRLFGNYLEVMSAPADIEDGSGQSPALREAIVFDDVWFRYDPEGPWVLRGLQLTIRRGVEFGLVVVK
jgi:ATP-binding cassette subfamily B protein